jgi:hypothetical protein
MDEAASAHLEQLLDEALEETFPASDPIAVTPASPGTPHLAGHAAPRR